MLQKIFTLSFSKNIFLEDDDDDGDGIPDQGKGLSKILLC